MAPIKLISGSSKSKRKRGTPPPPGDSSKSSSRNVFSNKRNLTLQLLLCLGGIGFFATNQIIQSRSVAVAVTSTAKGGGGGDQHHEVLAEVLKNQKILTEENQKLQKELAELKQQKGIVSTTTSTSASNQNRQLTTTTSTATSTTSTAISNPPFNKQTSKFTPHIEQILSIIKMTTLNKPEDWNNKPGEWPYHPQKFCPQSYSIIVDKPYSPPSAIECQVEGTWCALLLNLFAPRKHPNGMPGEVLASTKQNHLRTLPYNVSFGISTADMIKTGTMAFGNCLGSSGPNGGEFSMNNFQHAKAMLYSLDEEANNNPQSQPVKWEDRIQIPIFRGHSRLLDRWQRNTKGCPATGHITSGAFGPAVRPKAVLFSLQHPELLNARITDHWHSCLWLNATNGMDQLFGLGAEHETKTGLPDNNKIPSDQYYNQYQTAVVLGGIGAAFRTSQHLQAGQAVVLQRFTYEEWFVPYMKPYIHYIPLKEDLSDLQIQMEWVRDNPTKVKEIAIAGQQFYQDWISPQVTWQHWHEMLYSLSETLNGPNNNQYIADAKTKERLSKGTARQVWPAPIIPLRYIRDPNNPTGPFILEDYKTTRIPYWKVDGPPETREMCKKNPTPAKNNPNTGWCK